MKWLALAMVLVGCGPSPYVYEHGCVTVTSNLKLNETAVFAHIDLSHSFYEPQFGNFCGVASGSIHVIDEDIFPCPFSSPTGTCVGFTDTAGNVTLTRNMRSLFHELLHVKDFRRLDWSSSWHGDWETRGYWAADAEYDRAVLELPNPALP